MFHSLNEINLYKCIMYYVCIILYCIYTILCMFAAESDSELEVLASELVLSDSTENEVFTEQRPASQTCQQPSKLSPVIVLDQVKVPGKVNPTTDDSIDQQQIPTKTNTPNNYKVASSPCEIQQHLYNKGQRKTSTKTGAKFSPYVSPTVKDRVKAFEYSLVSSSSIDSPATVNRSVEKIGSVFSSPIDPKVSAAKVVVKNIMSAIKNTYNNIVGTPDGKDGNASKLDKSNCESSHLEASVQPSGTPERHNTENDILSAIVEENAAENEKTTKMSEDLTVTVKRLSKEDICLIKQSMLSSGTCDSRRSSNNRKSGRQSSIILRRSLPQRSSRSSLNNNRTSLLSKKLLKKAREVQLRKDMIEAAVQKQREKDQSENLEDSITIDTEDEEEVNLCMTIKTGLSNFLISTVRTYNSNTFLYIMWKLTLDKQW